MFIYSVRASTLKMIGVLLLFVTLVGVALLMGQGNAVSASGNPYEINYSGIKTKDDRVAFIQALGIEIDTASEESVAFRMPDDFDRVILGYNELQKRQGLDLSKYKNKRVTRYTYKVTNYAQEGDVYANLFIHRGKIVACDLSSADPAGFVVPLTLVDRTKLK